MNQFAIATFILPKVLKEYLKMWWVFVVIFLAGFVYLYPLRTIILNIVLVKFNAIFRSKDTMHIIADNANQKLMIINFIYRGQKNQLLINYDKDQVIGGLRRKYYLSSQNGSNIEILHLPGLPIVADPSKCNHILEFYDTIEDEVKTLPQYPKLIY